MNSFERKIYKTVAPTHDEIEETLRLIYNILKLPQIDKAENAAIKEGYEIASEILEKEWRTVGKIDWDKLHSAQARIIAEHAFDYLDGECTQKVLISVL